MNAAHKIIQLLNHHGELPARHLRTLLNHGRWWPFRYSPDAFYSLMARLETQHIVAYYEVRLDDHEAYLYGSYERVYRATPNAILNQKDSPCP